MRRLVYRLLWAALVVVQDGPMAVMVTMADGHTYRVEVAGSADEAIERIKRREGEFSTGWFVERGGTHLNIDHVVKMRAAKERPS